MDGYDRFLDRLAELPVKSSRTESKVEVEILKRIMTPEEAELASLLTGAPEPASAVAERADMSAEAMRDALDGLARKGVIFKVYTEEPLYMLVSMLPGIYDIQHKHKTPEDAKLWERYYKEALGEDFCKTGTPLIRVLPVKASITPEMTVFTYEEVEKIIDDSQAITLTDCICRHNKRLVGEACEAPVVNMCMFLDAWADYFAENNMGRRASKDEARQTLTRARDAGLVCNTLNVEHGSFAICACCGCCCVVLRGITELKIPGSVAKSNFMAEIAADHCVGCGTCVEACQVKALELLDDVAHVIDGRCIGCGICKVVCQFDAVSLKRRDDENRPPADMTELMGKIALGRLEG
ncbi:MAG: DUF362 domain-containing protein [Syntrophobacteraceae bacterium]